MKKIIKGAAVILLALLAGVAFARGDAVAFPFRKTEAEKAREKCEASGKLASAGPVLTNGLFLDGPDVAEPMLRAAQLLGEQRVSFVEFKRRPTSPNTMPRSAPRWDYREFAEDLVGPELDEPFVRLSIASIADPRCAPFKKRVAQTRFLAMSYRWAGITPDLCVAVDRVKELASTTERVFLEDESKNKGNVTGWFVLRSRGTGQVHARVWTDGGRYCRNQEEYRRLAELAEGSGSLLLEPLPKVVEVTEVIFPVRTQLRIERLGPEISDPTTTKEWKARFEPGAVRYDDLNAFGKLIDNAQTSLEPYYQRHNIPTVPGVSIDRAGYRLYLVRPGLRKIVLLADGSRLFNDCDRLRREANQIVVECRSFREAGAPEIAQRWGSWVLTYRDDGTPLKLFEIETGSPDGRIQVLDVELRDGVPRAALLSHGLSDAGGVRRVWHKATLDAKK